MYNDYSQLSTWYAALSQKQVTTSLQCIIWKDDNVHCGLRVWMSDHVIPAIATGKQTLFSQMFQYKPQSTHESEMKI